MSKLIVVSTFSAALVATSFGLAEAQAAGGTGGGTGGGAGAQSAPTTTAAPATSTAPTKTTAPATTSTGPSSNVPGSKPPELQQHDVKGCPPGQVGNKNSNDQGRFSKCH